MKKYIAIFGLLVGAQYAQAVMWDEVFTDTTITTNQLSITKTIRGPLKAIHIDLPGTNAGVVTVTSVQGVGTTTLFNATLTADAYIQPLYPAKTSTNTALTRLDGGSNSAPFLVEGIMAGAVTVKFTPGANTIETNRWQASIIYDRE